MIDNEYLARPGMKIIPLTVGRAAPVGERREALRHAVTQVVRHLVIKAVPDEERSAYFEQARSLLDEAGWGLDELLTAADEGPAQEELFRVLRLS